MPFQKFVTFFKNKENTHAAQRLFCGITDDLNDICSKENAVELVGYFFPKTHTAIKQNIKKIEEKKFQILLEGKER